MLTKSCLNRTRNLPNAYLIQGHSVELDSFRVLAQFEVDVSHVNFEPAGIIEHPVFGDDLVGYRYGI